jgi:myo-inositol-1(or 4)-monophosphatase
MHNIIETAQKAALVGGEILKKEFGKLKKDQIDFKGKGDYVTELDIRSEQAIIKEIKKEFPDHVIYAEETGKENRTSKYQWYIDPLDGTANYVQSIPIFCVSIAIEKEKELIAGVVYNPLLKEMFWAQKDRSAFLNEEKIHVSSKKKMSNSILASGFPWRSRPYLDPYMASFKDIFIASAGVRRMGSAALDLAYTACGRFDGFWEMKLKPYDIAAGILIIKEAGGIVTDFNGGDDFMTSGNVVAGNPSIHKKLLDVTKKRLAFV